MTSLSHEFTIGDREEQGLVPEIRGRARALPIKNSYFGTISMGINGSLV